MVVRRAPRRIGGRAGAPHPLPPAARRDGGRAARHAVDADGAVELHADDPVRALHALTGWALERGVPLEGLTVDRPSLEDVYLSLISEEDEA